MASLASTLSAPPATTTFFSRSASGSRPVTTPFSTAPRYMGLKVMVPTVNHITTKKGRSITKISCSAQSETLSIVQSMIAKQLSIDKSTVTPGTKFSDLGADSLDTVEIMMALEEKFEVSVGEGGAESIATVQDAADLIEKVKAATA